MELEQGDTCPALDVVLGGGRAVRTMKNATQLHKTNNDFKLNSERWGRTNLHSKEFLQAI